MRILRPIRPEDLEPLVAAAAADAHEVWFPTHVVTDPEGTIVGYASVNLRPAIVFVWMDSRRNSARDSVTALRSMEDYLRMSGVTDYLMPCAPSSPYLAHMGKLGFKEKGPCLWFSRNLTGDGSRGVPQPACAGHITAAPQPTSTE